MEPIIGIVIGLVVGIAIGYFALKTLMAKQAREKIEEANKASDLAVQEARLTAKRMIDEAEIKAENIVSKAESRNEIVKQKKIQEAREKFNQLKSEFDTERNKHLLSMKDREVVVVSQENELKQKMQSLQSKTEELNLKKQEVELREVEAESIRENLNRQLAIVNKKREELDSANELRIKELEKLAQLTEQQAKEQLLEAVKAKAENDAMSIVKEAISRAKVDAGKEAKKIVIQTIQRMCAEYTIENTVSVFNLDSDELKGQIIGREGRNIRALEAATGAEIVVDDTPEAIVISSFDPIRREVARLALKKLVADGRIHPARIEEVVAKVRKQLEEQIVEIGERTVIDLDLHGLNPIWCEW
jgi:ribonuclease Y